MQQPNQIDQSDSILAALKEYEEAQAELEQVKRLTSPVTYIDERSRSSTDWPRMEAVQRRIANLPTPPDRDTAIAACVAELSRLSSEFQATQGGLVAALQAEAEATIDVKAAEIRQQFALGHPLSGFSTKHEPILEAKAALDRAENFRRVISTRRSDILRYVEEQYSGADLARPATFVAAAAGRVDRIWGWYYTHAEATEIKTRLGISDDLLSRLARLVNPA